MWTLLGSVVGALTGIVLGVCMGRPFGVPVDVATVGMILGGATGAGYFTVLFDNPPKLKPYPMFTFTLIYVAIGLAMAQLDHATPRAQIVVALTSGMLGLSVGWDIQRRLRRRQRCMDHHPIKP